MVYRFASMTTKEKLESRRFVIKTSIQAVSVNKSAYVGIIKLCADIGKVLGISGQTVYNYTRGNISDGYLADAILIELKKYKPSKINP